MRKAAEGCTMPHWMSKRTIPWVPSDAKALPIEEVHITPCDIAYYFLALLMKDLPPPPKGQSFPEGHEQAFLIGIAQALVDCDFEETHNNILGDLAEFDRWLWAACQRKTYEGGFRKPRMTHEVAWHWWRFEEARSMTLEDLKRHPCSGYSRRAGLTETVWRTTKEARAAGGQTTTSTASSSTGTTPKWFPPTSKAKGEPSRWVRGATLGTLVGSSYAVDSVVHAQKVTSCALIQTLEVVEQQSSISWFTVIFFGAWTLSCIVIGCFISGCITGYGDRGCLDGDSEQKVMRNVSTQCNLLSLDPEEIEEMTIQAIRAELHTYQGACDGVKAKLVARLQEFRRRFNEEQEAMRTRTL